MMVAMTAVRPNLWFANQALEAAQFYASVFPDGQIEQVVHGPVATPGTAVGDVLLVEFTMAGQRIVAFNGEPGRPFTEAMSLEIVCEDQAEADYYWGALVAGGGQHSMCGWLKDRYGVSWQVVPREVNDLLTGPDPDGAARAWLALMEMTRLDVAALRVAYDGE